MIIKQKILFNIDECNSIIDLTKSNLKNWELYDRTYHSLTIKNENNTEWIFNRLKLFFESEVGLKINKLKKEIHFHKFVKGDWFGKHSDNVNDRVYAVGVLLNNNFSGGDFKLYDINNTTLDKEIGNTYIFDVNIEHEITEIIQGERYSLLWFLQKEHLKFQTNKLL